MAKANRRNYFANWENVKTFPHEISIFRASDHFKNQELVNEGKQVKSLHPCRMHSHLFLPVIPTM